ncbi:TonB C-terminal domain-containing protein [Geobacter sp. SVR]|uniref:TonB C-terminal domain-containing protein n=1 Tax=Geobacter sp. SVR TaxID=2495594 RepID=UPI00143F030A|nr:TonB C-terminal domain-containing protein [Geobacter sp. SVR]BCS55262.1 TonB-dependent receptor [Geobacter sp. SVR]GCF86061.1 TonB-dependent receptor [Geobacter sp. SVR]
MRRISDRYVEKSFLYLLVLSLLLHLGALALLLYLPQSGKQLAKEPVFIDLQTVPELKRQEPPRQPETPRLPERRAPVSPKTSPPVAGLRNRTPEPDRELPRRPVQPSQPAPRESQPEKRPNAPSTGERRESQIPPGSSASSLLKPRQSAKPQGTPQLFPSAGRIAKLEQEYRRTFEGNGAEGESRLLNTSDPGLVSFFKRLENAVYGVWRIPPGGETLTGEVVVMATFNSRTGEIVAIKSIEGSGHRVLDDEVFRVLHTIGPVGPLPKGYDKPEHDLFMIFRYGGSFVRIIR